MLRPSSWCGEAPHLLGGHSACEDFEEVDVRQRFRASHLDLVINGANYPLDISAIVEYAQDFHYGLRIVNSIEDVVVLVCRPTNLA